MAFHIIRKWFVHRQSHSHKQFKSGMQSNIFSISVFFFSSYFQHFSMHTFISYLMWHGGFYMQKNLSYRKWHATFVDLFGHSIIKKIKWEKRIEMEIMQRASSQLYSQNWNALTRRSYISERFITTRLIVLIFFEKKKILCCWNYLLCNSTSCMYWSL